MIDFEKLISTSLERTERKYFPRDDVIHVSEIWGCMRKNYFHHKIFRRHPARSLKVFMLGNMVHEKMSELLQKCEGVGKVESEVTMWKYLPEEDFLITGTLDDLIHFKNGNKMLLEKKSARSLPTIPNPHHVAQCNFYMGMRGVKKGQILYIKKNDIQTKSFRINFNIKMFNESIARAASLVEHLKKRIIPVAEAKMNSDRSWECEYCLYKDICDGMSNVEYKDVTGEKK